MTLAIPILLHTCELEELLTKTEKGRNSPYPTITGLLGTIALTSVIRLSSTMDLSSCRQVTLGSLFGEPRTLLGQSYVYRLRFLIKSTNRAKVSGLLQI